MQRETLIKIRVGLPQRGGALVKAARQAALPCLISANAFAKYDSEGRFERFVTPWKGAFDGMDVALDSAGFVAATRYGGYTWSVDAYVGLAGAADWAFWAAMDLCVESEVASDRVTRRMRVAGSARGYAECRRAADEKGIARPMPVLQGYTVGDYLECIDLMPVAEWPELVGVGSVCRREVRGENGLERVVDGLDKALPKHVRLHMFGIKSAAVEVFARHPRVASTDSQAWDYAARRKRPTGRTQAFRAEEMLSWKRKQDARAEVAPGAQLGLLAGEREAVESEYLECLGEWADLVASGEIDYQSATIHAMRELRWKSKKDGTAMRMTEQDAE